MNTYSGALDPHLPPSNASVLSGLSLVDSGGQFGIRANYNDTVLYDLPPQLAGPVRAAGIDPPQQTNNNQLQCCTALDWLQQLAYSTVDTVQDIQ